MKPHDSPKAPVNLGQLRRALDNAAYCQQPITDAQLALLDALVGSLNLHPQYQQLFTDRLALVHSKAVQQRQAQLLKGEAHHV